MSTQKKYMGSSHFKNTAIAIAVASSFVMAQAWAADTAVGSGTGVAYGTGSNAPKAENVAVGKGASISYSNGGSAATGDIVVGDGANINNYASQGGSIAIGKNAKIENMAGGGEASFALGQTTYSGSIFSSARIPADPTKVVGSIAIGDNTFARTGSTMIGSHNYSGDLGDTTVDSSQTRASNLNVYATTIGANSFSNGAFTTTTGVYNIISGEYNGGRSANGQKNFGATITGTLNSVESMGSAGSDYYSGIANSLIGIANRTQNSNGSLIFGAGNEITNSYASISGLPGGLFSSTPSSAKDLANTLRESVKDSDAGGATLAIGGANKADYTQRSQMIGVKNSITGTAGNVSTNNMVNGYANEAENVKNVSVIGSKNKIENTNTAIVVGDKRTLNSADNSVILGSSAGGTTTNVKKAVAIGAESNVTVEGGVALGADSIASTAAGIAGYDLSTGTASTDTSATWKSTAAAVSVGDVDHEVTRQITGVAAGLNDTDAVNVAQLKKAAAAATTTVATTDRNLTVAETPSGSHNYQVGLNKDLIGMQSAEFTNATGTEQTRISQAGVVITKDSTTTVSLKATGLDNGGQTITNVYAGSNDTDAVNVRQLKDSRSQVETAQPKYVQIQTSRENPATNSGATIYSVGLSPYAQSGIDYSNTYLGPDGIDANGKKITGVAAGSVSANSTDAVNGSQLYQTNQAVQQNSDNISKLYNRSAELNRKIHRAGAHAAALAALHPLDFDENHRVSASLGLGQYHSSGAAALGIFVRPTENFMVSLGGSIASGSDVMGNLGVHYRFGGDSVRVNKTELTQQVSTLTAENRDLSAKLASSNSKLEAATSKIDSLMERIHAIEAKLNMK